MRILILGSHGFIGSNAVLLLRQRGYEVWGCDLYPLVQDHYFCLNVQTPNYAELFERQQFDVCINCMGAAHVPNSFLKPRLDFELNTQAVYDILLAIRTHNPTCKFINLSSAAVYGNPIQLPVNEQTTLAPVSPYGFHKKMAEDICAEFARCFGLSTCSLRIFSAYGQGLRKQIFWDVYQKTLQHTAIQLFGTGNETRDFIYIKDLIVLFELIIQKGIFDGRVLNAASGVETPIRTAVQTLLEELNWTGTLTFSGETRVGDPLYWQADIQQIQQLGFAPQYTLQQGLKNYINWIKLL